jgi:hypothetical protein
VHGKAALRNYWSTALSQQADLRFEVVGVYRGESTLVINYRNHRGQLVNEVLTLDADGLVREGPWHVSGLAPRRLFSRVLPALFPANCRFVPLRQRKGTDLDEGPDGGTVGDPSERASSTSGASFELRRAGR